MPPYLRFPEPEVITQKFWGFRSRNPTCGLISWEIGTLIFAWGNTLYGAVTAIGCVLIFLLHYTDPITSRGDILSSMKDGKKLSQRDADWLERIYLNKSVAMVQSIIFFSFLYFSMWWYLSWNLKSAVVERDRPTLKKYCVIMLSLMIFSVILTLWDLESVWSLGFIAEIPWDIFQIMGLMFTHGYIASLNSPGVGGGQEADDQSQMQFS